MNSSEREKFKAILNECLGKVKVDPKKITIDTKFKYNPDRNTLQIPSFRNVDGKWTTINWNTLEEIKLDDEELKYMILFNVIKGKHQDDNGLYKITSSETTHLMVSSIAVLSICLGRFVGVIPYTSFLAYNNFYKLREQQHIQNVNQEVLKITENRKAMLSAQRNTPESFFWQLRSHWSNSPFKFFNGYYVGRKF